jgi:hypothetical protein
VAAADAGLRAPADALDLERGLALHMGLGHVDDVCESVHVTTSM